MPARRPAEGHPARGRPHRPGRQRPRHRASVRAKRASRIASSKRGPGRRAARAMFDAMQSGAARAGRRPSSGSASRPASSCADAVRVAARRAVRQADSPRARRRARTPASTASWVVARRRSRARRRSTPRGAHAAARCGLRRSVQADAGFPVGGDQARRQGLRTIARQEDHLHAQDRHGVSRRRRDHHDEPRSSASASRPSCSSRSSGTCATKIAMRC